MPNRMPDIIYFFTFKDYLCLRSDRGRSSFGLVYSSWKHDSFSLRFLHPVLCETLSVQICGRYLVEFVRRVVLARV